MTHDNPRHQRPADNPRDKVRRSLDEAARPEEDLEKKERNSGIAILVLAIVVGLLLVAIVSGATDAFQP
ncbi:MAG TPA: hypothetical protein VF314_05150 [Actinomycetes bacterium]